MHWRYADDLNPISEGLRTILLNYQRQAAVKTFALTIEPDGEICDIFVCTNSLGASSLSMRVTGEQDWVPLTQQPDTTFQLRDVQGTTTDVDLQVIVPTLTIPEPMELPLRIVWDRPQS